MLARPANSHAGEMEPRAAQWAAGPLQFTWVVAETYRRHALEFIPRMANDEAGRRALAAPPRDV